MVYTFFFWFAQYKEHTMTCHTYVQIDLETLSLKQRTAPVVSLGAVAYQYEKRIFDTFYYRFDLDEQFYELGRVPNSDTLKWWLRQPDAARAVFHDDGIIVGPNAGYGQVAKVEAAFHTWWTGVHNANLANGAPIVLSKGPNFDIAILEMLFSSVPWNYRNVMCWRTLERCHKSKIIYPEKTVSHDALEDAKYQALAHLSLIDIMEDLR